jgi:UDP-N-acetylmuramoylalanine--D-glutamate ligase
MLYDTVLFEVADCHLPGKHNLQNCMVAACMAYRMGVTLEDIRAGISEFKGVEHRLEYVETIDGVRYYNDSKGTNTDATITALKSFDQRVILIAGGYDKKTGFEELRPYLDKIQLMVVYGETKLQLKRLMPSAIVCDNLMDAVEVVFDKAQKGDVVLFSPVCASWDQFKNFEERGRIFKQLVRNHLD